MEFEDSLGYRKLKKKAIVAKVFSTFQIRYGYNKVKIEVILGKPKPGVQQGDPIFLKPGIQQAGLPTTTTNAHTFVQVG